MDVPVASVAGLPQIALRALKRAHTSTAEPYPPAGLSDNLGVLENRGPTERLC
jgi:hypothetical protein